MSALCAQFYFILNWLNTECDRWTNKWNVMWLQVQLFFSRWHQKNLRKFSQYQKENGWKLTPGKEKIAGKVFSPWGVSTSLPGYWYPSGNTRSRPWVFRTNDTWQASAFLWNVWILQDINSMCLITAQDTAQGTISYSSVLTTNL